ncbi:DinB family protein [Hymenobacter sp. BT683]|uniref:DinB family protein n=1 Tax=Hymenobacter jeongseonensis TaxID=2791027 RepID=A0ABS0IKN2_9BACT|nr:DinB family protein [Hymenobacter jeongseonensis]MBF9238722.1 DinB family protein [Hymenobacter jeongseonensis]
MSETARIIDQLRQAFDGEPWSGPSLLTNLNGITAAQAAQHPVAAAHSIWEITRHAGVWAEVVTRRIQQNAQLEISDAEDWPAPPENPTEADWQQVLSELRAAHERLLQTAAAVADDSLDHTIGVFPDKAQSPGSSAYVMLHGVAQHYLYHAGQIALLRKAIS